MKLLLSLGLTSGLLCFISYFSLCLGKENGNYRAWDGEIDAVELEDILKKDPYIVVYYAHTPVNSDELRRFNSNFATAKLYLKDFLCTLTIVNCYQHEDGKPPCQQQTNSEHVYFYRKGKLVVDVPVDSMFNEDSIVSNILHLVLLQEVPIIQNKAELKTLMKKHQGKRDIVFARLLAVGIPEDRVFIETAFAFSSTHQFALTTLNDDLVGDSEWSDGENKIWFLQCALAWADESCPVIPYRNAITLEGMVLFVKSIAASNLIELTKDAVINFPALGLKTVYISTTTQEFQNTKDIISRLAQDFTGSIGFVHLNRDKLENGEIEVDIAMPVCETVCLFIKTDEGVLKMDTELSYNTAWAYLSIHLNKELQRAQDEQQAEEKEEEEEEQPYIYTTKQEVQDDPVQKAVHKLELSRKLNISFTPQLTDKTFFDFTDRDSLSMVLFTIKWNPRCIAFLESYAKLGFILQQHGAYTQNPLARVECSNWPDVCDLNNVTAYPKIKVFRNSELVSDYRGPLQESRLLQFYYTQNSSSPLYLQSEDDLEHFILGSEPEWASDVLKEVVLGVFPSSSSKEQRVFKVAAKILKERHLSGICSGECVQYAEAEFDHKAPFVVVVKWHDPHQSQVIFDEVFTVPEVIKFVYESTRLLLPELTPETLPGLMQKSPMLVILFFKDSDLSEEAEQKLAQVALMEEFRHVGMAWLDASGKNDHIMETFLSDEEASSNIPNIVMVNRQIKSLCHYPHQSTIEVGLIKDWLLGAIEEGRGCSVGLRHREWKPLVPPYNFLSLIKGDKPDEEIHEPSGRPRNPIVGVTNPEMEKASNEEALNNVQTHIHSEL